MTEPGDGSAPHDHAPATPAPRGHVTPIQVRFGDTDALGHLNNASYAFYAEAARLDFVGALGERVQSLILAHLAIDFRRQVTFGQQVEVRTSVERIGRSSVTLMQRVLADGVVAAEMQSVVVLFDYATQTAVEIPAAMRERLGEYVAG